MLPTYNQGHAKTHYAYLHRPLEDDEDIEALAEEVTTKLLSGEVVLNDLARGDIIQVESYPNQEENIDEPYIFFAEVDRVLPAPDTICRIPEVFYWPLFTLDYWKDLDRKETNIPVRFNEVYQLTAKDVVLFPITESELEPAPVPTYTKKIITRDGNVKSTPLPEDPTHVYGVETPEFVIIYPAYSPDMTKEQIATKIMSTTCVDVFFPDDEWVQPYGMSWETEVATFKTNKPILSVIVDPEA